MSKYDIKESYDVESGKDVRLTSYNKSPMDDYGKNFVHKNERNVAEKPDVVQPNGTALTNNIFSNSIEIGDYERSEDSPLGNSSCCSWLDQKIQTTFRRKMLYKRIPIIQWLPHYRKEYIVSDMVAGFTVGLTVIPQAIAYANVAGLPLQYGLYSSFMACFVYTIFGSCKDVPVGPTAIAAIMTHETLEKSHLGPDFAVLLTFISGCVCMLMGTLQLGKL
ncbi:hypothetical protein TKK_0004572 [Trichogramma kaykai]|uniref:SLC26A/SulP transporter domain-containing protein n=1 Tax=Trichogramma kaykai TaxID=54128 RepID=A0ABD2XMZ3_9HYME